MRQLSLPGTTPHINTHTHTHTHKLSHSHGWLYTHARSHQWHYAECNFADGGAPLLLDAGSTDSEARYTIRAADKNQRLYLSTSRGNMGYLIPPFPPPHGVCMCG